MTKEFRVKISLKNNRLLRERELLGLNQKQLAKAAGISLDAYYNLESCNTGKLSEANIIKSCSLLAIFFDKEVDYLFPDVVMDIKKRSVEFEMSKDQMMYMLQDSVEGYLPENALEKKEKRKALCAAISRLEKRDKKYIKNIYIDEMNMAEIAERDGITHQRVQHLLARAHLRLREKIIKKGLFLDEQQRFEIREKEGEEQ